MGGYGHDRLPTTMNPSLSTQFFNLRTYFLNHIPSMIKPP